MTPKLLAALLAVACCGCGERYSIATDGTNYVVRAWYGSVYGPYDLDEACELKLLLESDRTERDREREKRRAELKAITKSWRPVQCE